MSQDLVMSRTYGRGGSAPDLLLVLVSTVDTGNDELENPNGNDERDCGWLRYQRSRTSRRRKGGL